MTIPLWAFALPDGYLHLANFLVNAGANLFIQSAILIAVGLALTRFLRRRGSAVQSVVLRGVLVALILSPILSLTLSKMGLSIVSLPLPRAEWSATVEPGVIEEASVGRPEDISSRTTISGLTNALSEEAATGTSARVRSLPPLEAVASADVSRGFTPLAWAYFVLSGLWIAGALGLLGWLAICHIMMAKLRRRARSAPEECSRTCQSLANLLEVKCPKVVRSQEVKSPLLTGLFSPVIIFPDVEEVEETVASDAVFIHELAHLKRRDCLWNLIARTLSSLLFYQPLVRLLARKAEEVSDDVCDDYVIRYGCARKAYARQLTYLAQRFQPGLDEAAVGAGVVRFRSSLGRRVVRILDASRRLATATPRRTVYLAAFGVLIGAVLAGTLGFLPMASAPKPIAAAEEQEKPAESETISVKGRVVNEKGEPVKDAKVSAYYVSFDEDIYKIQASIDTDGKGAFSFENLPTTEDLDAYYQFFVQARGYGFGFSPTRYVKDGPVFEGLAITLGERDYISGLIVDIPGEPIPGAEVAVRSIQFYEKDLISKSIYFSRMGLPILFGDETNRVGYFKIDGLPVGSEVSVVTKHKDFATIFHSTKTGDKACNLRLPIAGKITGRVIYAENRKPAVGVKIWAQQVFGSSGLPLFIAVFNKVTTDSAGIYKITHLPPGLYNICLDDCTDFTAVAAEKLRIREGISFHGVNLELIEGAIIKGKVSDAETGKPIKGARIAIHGPSRPRSGGAVWGIESRADGSYEIRVAPGEDHVYYQGNLYEEGYLWELSRHAAKDVVVEEGQILEDVNFKLNKTKPEKEKSGAEVPAKKSAPTTEKSERPVEYEAVSLKGRVVNEKGEAVVRLVAVGNLKTGRTVDAKGTEIDAAAIGLKVPRPGELDNSLVVWLDIPGGDRKSIVGYWLADPENAKRLGSGGSTWRDIYQAVDGSTVCRATTKMKMPPASWWPLQLHARVATGNWQVVGRPILVAAYQRLVSTHEMPYPLSPLEGIVVPGLNQAGDDVRLSLMVPKSAWRQWVFWARGQRKDGQMIEPTAWNPGTEVAPLLSFRFERTKLSELELIFVERRQCHEVALDIPKISDLTEIPDERTDEPLDIGTLELKVFQPAPLFETKTLDGEVLKLEDFRGKFVLLDFWAVWCGPCRGETPYLKAAYEAFGENERFVIVGLSLDKDVEAPKKYVAENDLKWIQGFLGEWTRTKVPDEYGVWGIPAIFLIGPDGKVIAKGLRGEEIKQAVEQALKKSNPTLNEKVGKAPEAVSVAGRVVNEKGEPAAVGAVLRGKYVTKHDLRIANRPIFVSTFSPKLPSWEVMTRADGSFVVTGIPPDTHGFIDFTGTSGYHVSVKMSKTYPFFKIEGRGIRFRDVPAGVYDGVEIHFLLEGRVKGVVADSAGKPLPGLHIVVQETRRFEETDSKGRYSVEVPPNEEVNVEVQVPPSRRKILYIKPFRVKEGEIVEKNITIKGDIRQFLEQKYGEELAGRVVTPDGKPVAEATVCLSNNSVIPADVAGSCLGGKEACPLPPTWKGGISRPAFLKSDAEGRFSFNMLYPGKTDVWAEHPRFGWGWVRDISTDKKDVKIVLKRQLEKVTFSGTVLALDGKPLADTSIYLYAEESNEWTLIAQSITNAKGKFLLQAVPPWCHFRYLTLLCIPKDGPIAWKILPYCSGKDIQLRLKREVRVLGRVVNSRGKAVAKATVRLYWADDSDCGRMFSWGEMVNVAPSTETDAEGNFELDKIPVGNLVALVASHPDYVQEDAGHILVIADETRIADIEMPDGITIEGIVRYAETDDPAEGITVTLGFPGESGPQAITDSEGKYRLRGIDESSWPRTLRAEGGGTPPEWVGQAVIEKVLRYGDLVTGVDIIVRKSVEARQRDWRTQRGKPVSGKSWIAVLDDSDPIYNGKETYADTVTVYDSAGTQKWQFTGLNICQSVGANNGIAWNASDKALWVTEKVGDRLIKLGRDGTILWQKVDMKPEALTVDPKSGNVWVLTSEGTIYGKSLLVLSPSGEIVHDWDIGAFDIAYSEHDDCFWLVGKKVVKIDRKGKLLYESPQEFAWLAVSVAVNDLDGSVWIVERRHSQLAGSKDRLWILNSDGQTRKRIDLEGRHPICVRVDAKRGFAWVASRGVLKLTLEGDIIADIPLRGFSLGVESDTGYVWVAGHNGLYRLDLSGNLVWSKETPGGSQKWLCVIPQ